VFASVGKRTTGTGAGSFVIVQSGWRGEISEGLQRIDAPTPFVWIIGRTQTNGPEDYAAVHQVQNGYTLTGLSHFRKGSQPLSVTVDPTVDMKTPPMAQVSNMAADKYFAYASELLKFNPPHLTDQPIVARMRRLGFEPGKSFDLGQADVAVQRALECIVSDGLKAMQAKAPSLARVVNGWQMNTDTMGVYGTYYLKRAIVALVVLGANLPEDAIYPLNVGDADGNPPERCEQVPDAFREERDSPRERLLVGHPVRQRRVPDGQCSESNRDRRPRRIKVQCGWLA
jgi:hypothetical protein